jgi:hypothetical protein
MAYVHLLLGELEAYEAWSTFLFDFRGLALLPALLWALRYADPGCKPLYARLAPAFVLLQLGVHGSFDAEVAGLPGKYAPPKSRVRLS